jgi:hypothetical protein
MTTTGLCGKSFCSSAAKNGCADGQCRKKPALRQPPVAARALARREFDEMSANRLLVAFAGESCGKRETFAANRRRVKPPAARLSLTAAGTSPQFRAMTMAEFWMMLPFALLLGAMAAAPVLRAALVAAALRQSRARTRRGHGRLLSAGLARHAPASRRRRTNTSASSRWSARCSSCPAASTSAPRARPPR